MTTVVQSNSGLVWDEPAVETTEGVCGGAPVVPGTRIPAALLHDFVHVLGWDLLEVCREYPHVLPQRIMRAVAWIAEHPAYLVEWREGQEE